MLTVTGLDHFVLRIRDLDASLRFYRDLLRLAVLFLEEYRAGQRPFVSIRIGEQLLDLVPDATYDPEEGTRTGGFLHFCVGIAPGHLATIVPWLHAQGVTVIEDEPVQRMGARGRGLSIYVTDPDGYIVELKEQPA